MPSTLLAAAGAAGAQTELLLLRRAEVRPCRGCLACEGRDEAGRGSCVIEDDMRVILPKLLAGKGVAGLAKVPGDAARQPSLARKLEELGRRLSWPPAAAPAISHQAAKLTQ